jgi:hypothetical protein
VKFALTVFLEPVGSEHLVEALAKALAPFDYNGDYRGEEVDVWAAWDRWWTPGGEGLPLKTDSLHDPRVWRDEDTVVAAPKGTIDFGASRQAAHEYAAGAWNAWAEIAAAHPGALPLAHFEAQGLDRAEAKGEWLSQPAVQAVAQAAATQEHPYFDFSLLLSDPVAVFSGEREDLLYRAAAESFATHAYITLDGQWLTEETGDRGWTAHAIAMAQYLDSLPDETVVVQIMCHF